MKDFDVKTAFLYGFLILSIIFGACLFKDLEGLIWFEQSERPSLVGTFASNILLFLGASIVGGFLAGKFLAKR